MSKKEIDFNKLGSANKPTVKKLDIPLDAEKAVQSIHDQKSEKERTKRITVDLPFSLYVDIRKRLIEEESTLKDYFIKLAKTDID